MFRKNNLEPKFLLTWKKTFPWISEVREDVYYAKMQFIWRWQFQNR